MNLNVEMPKHRMTGTAAYAGNSDFCRIFLQDMSSLYLLAFLLTANHDQAEQCFVAGIEDCAGESRVFREWAHAWARRTIIQNAIRLIAPTWTMSAGCPSAVPENHSHVLKSSGGFLDPVLQLDAFDRFVFVMSVLEGLSDHDCSLLLGCARQQVIARRAHALMRLAETNAMYVQSREGLRDSPAYSR